MPEADRRGALPGWAGWGVLAGRLVLGGVLVAAGLAKLPDPDASVRAVRAYQLLPETVVPAVGYGLPVLEVVVGVLLVVGLAVRLSAVVAAVLMAAFVGGIASAWTRGLTIDCGCFGGGGTVAAGETTYGLDLARDAGLLAIALALARWPHGRLALAGSSPSAQTDTTEEQAWPSAR